MKWKGHELIEITESQFFDPPKKMMVWDDGYLEPHEREVCAITPQGVFVRFNTKDAKVYDYCAEIPEESSKITDLLRQCRMASERLAKTKEKKDLDIINSQDEFREIAQSVVDDYGNAMKELYEMVDRHVVASTQFTGNTGCLDFSLEYDRWLGMPSFRVNLCSVDNEHMIPVISAIFRDDGKYSEGLADNCTLKSENTKEINDLSYWYRFNLLSFGQCVMDAITEETNRISNQLKVLDA